MKANIDKFLSEIITSNNDEKICEITNNEERNIDTNPQTNFDNHVDKESDEIHSLKLELERQKN